MGTIEKFLSGESSLEDSFEIPDEVIANKMTQI